MNRFFVKSDNIIMPDGIRRGAIEINGSTIKAIHDRVPKDVKGPVEDVGHLFVMAGIVDTHVHVNEPGRTDWEGFDTATKAAAAGGVTTVIDMPLNCIPVSTSLNALKVKKAGISKKLWVDCGFHGGVIPGNIKEIQPLIEAGVRAFKAFLVNSGIDEFPAVTRQDLEAVLPILSAHDIPLLLHAELDLKTTEPATHTNRRSYQEFLLSRPDRMEVDAVNLAIDLAKRFDARIHIVHLSSAQALNAIAQAREQGVRITAETCPHYLSIAAEEIPDGNPLYKCMPPIRSVKNQRLLWQGLHAGTIDLIVSDHSPCTPELKKIPEENIRDAWGGISSLQYGLAVIWSQGKLYDLSPLKLSRWMCQEPARLVGLTGKKGSIAPGFDADLAIWDPDLETIISPANTFHRHKRSPYENRHVIGRNQITYLRGQKIYEYGKILGTPTGEFL